MALIKVLCPCGYLLTTVGRNTSGSKKCSACGKIVKFKTDNDTYCVGYKD